MHSDQNIKTKIIETLSRNSTMTLATNRPDGFPHATTVNYINDDLLLYFAVDAASQKAGNIKLNNKIAIAIADQTEDFRKLRGISMSGFAKRIVQKEDAHELALRLFQKIPQSKRYVPATDQNIAVFEVTPVAISLIDYSTGFGNSSLFIV